MVDGNPRDLLHADEFSAVSAGRTKTGCPVLLHKPLYGEGVRSEHDRNAISGPWRGRRRERMVRLFEIAVET